MNGSIDYKGTTFETLEHSRPACGQAVTLTGTRKAMGQVASYKGEVGLIYNNLNNDYESSFGALAGMV